MPFHLTLYSNIVSNDIFLKFFYFEHTIDTNAYKNTRTQTSPIGRVRHGDTKYGTY